MSGEKIRAFGDALTSIIKAIKFKCTCKCCESNCNEPNSPNVSLSRNAGINDNVSLQGKTGSQKIFDYAQRGEVTNL